MNMRRLSQPARFAIVLLGAWCASALGAPAGLEEFNRALSEARQQKTCGREADEDAALARARHVLGKLERQPANALLESDYVALLDRHRFQRAHRLGATEIDALYQDLDNTARAGRAGVKGGLYEHLDEAIKSHERRIPIYARLTDGRSTPLFRKIAVLQRLNLPIAWYIDLRARKFQKQGIPVIIGDLISMDTINPTETPPRHNGTVGDATLADLRTRLRSFQKATMHDLRRSAFRDIAARTAELIRFVQAIETRESCHMAMTLHMLESIGLTALHGERWARLSKGETAGLTRLFLAIQVFPMQECPKTDRKAQDLHALGVGVIVNDVPHIPFMKEWEAAGPAR